MTHPGGLCLALAVSFTLVLLAVIAGALTRRPGSDMAKRLAAAGVAAQLPRWLQPDLTLLAVSRT